MLGKAEHVINGKKVDPKKAKARHGKIFVGGLKPEMTDDDIKNHFAAMGTVRAGTGGTAPQCGEIIFSYGVGCRQKLPFRVACCRTNKMLIFK